MGDLADGEVFHLQGSASKPYELKNTGGVYSCSCPAWRNQSIGIEKRTCKHLKKLRGDAAEAARVGSAAPPPRKTGDDAEDEGKEGPPLLLAERWDQVQDLSGWWMSEKLDGVRAYWDGKQFLSRLGNPYHAPEWFVKGLPPVPLDGELWAGRKLFQKTVSIVRRQDRSEHWKEIRFLVFDAPALDSPFEERLALCRTSVEKAASAHVGLHEHQECRSLDRLRSELARVESLGGEGLMLRQPASKYVVGRSSTLLKIKSFHDAEARVVGHSAGAGRHQGRLGALEVETADGVRFSVGTGLSDAEREAPPPKGAWITYRFQELSTGGVPRFPSFVRVRAGSAPEPAKPAAAPEASSAPRRFEFSEGTSNKFWEVSVSGRDLTVTYGRAGTAGQTKTKTFASEAAARRELDDLVAEKTGKGYRER